MFETKLFVLTTNKRFSIEKFRTLTIFSKIVFIRFSQFFPIKTIFATNWLFVPLRKSIKPSFGDVIISSTDIKFEQPWIQSSYLIFCLCLLSIPTILVFLKSSHLPWLCLVIVNPVSEARSNMFRKCASNLFENQLFLFEVVVLRSLLCSLPATNVYHSNWELISCQKSNL